MNKYLISVDIEGITGVISSEFSGSSGRHYSLAQKYMASDVNAVIKGILKADSEAIIVIRDAHGKGASNLDIEKIHPRASIIQGWGNAINMVETVDETYSGVFLVGYHAGGNNINAVLAHTMSSHIQHIKVNDMLINESGVSGLYAGYHKVPIAFISGDNYAIQEAKEQLNGIVGVTVKQSLGRDAALSVSLNEAQNLLENGAYEATLLLKQKEISPFALSSPIKTEIKLYNVGYAISVFAKIKGMIGFDKTYIFDDENFVISFSAKDQLEAFQRINLLVLLTYAA